MKTSGILALITAVGAALAAPVDEVEVVARGNLPGLDAVQTANANAVIAENKKENLGRQGCLAAITTAITESSIKILANNKVPESLKYKHDGLGSDHDSIGIFQQRASIYKNVQCDMGAACSASQFFTGMKAIKGWQTMDVPDLCQAVQHSAPNVYRRNLAAATSICKAAGY